MSLIRAAVLDLEDNSLYWEHYKGKAAETMHDINDAYLKAEGLQEGYASYDLVVDMIVTYLTAKRGNRTKDQYPFLPLSGWP